jgi:hypothetical protein
MIMFYIIAEMFAFLAYRESKALAKEQGVYEHYIELFIDFLLIGNSFIS